MHLFLAMERQNSRRNSTSSIRSQTNSANIDCSEEHTHAVVRREKDKKVVLVSLNNFVNFGKTVKVNEIATYKGSADSRKSDRGKVLLFGELLNIEPFSRITVLLTSFKVPRTCVLRSFNFYKKILSKKNIFRKNHRVNATILIHTSCFFKSKTERSYFLIVW